MQEQIPALTKRMSRLLKREKYALQQASEFRKEADRVSKKLSTLRKELKELEDKLNGPCPWYSCTCPSTHGTDCHDDGYLCKDWPKRIPCEADYRCQLRVSIKKLRNSIDRLSQVRNNEQSGAKANRNVARSLRQEKSAAKQDIDKKKAIIARLDCETFTTKRIELIEDKERVTKRYEVVKKEASEFGKYFSRLSRYLSELHSQEIAVYSACARSQNGAISKSAYEQESDYKELLLSLRDVDILGDIIVNSGYPQKPTTLWRSQGKQSR